MLTRLKAFLLDDQACVGNEGQSRMRTAFAEGVPGTAKRTNS